MKGPSSLADLLAVTWDFESTSMQLPKTLQFYFVWQLTSPPAIRGGWFGETGRQKSSLPSTLRYLSTSGTAQLDKITITAVGKAAQLCEDVCLEAAWFICNSIHVDDPLPRDDNLEKLKSICQGLDSIVEKGGFK
jgi:hypothetical protein